MPDPYKTVFIAYRRNVSRYIARAIFQDLREHGYDVFLDIETIDSGQFEKIILNQIAARAHFLVILSAGTAERFIEPGDWLRREIEYAIELDRNIVPIFIDDFHYGGKQEYFQGKLSELPKYNGISILYDYFDAGMEKLRTRFLSQPVATNLTPAPKDSEQKAQQQIRNVAEQPAPTISQLQAEQHLMRGFYHATRGGDLERAVIDFKKALELNPEYETQFEQFKIDKSSKKHIFLSYSRQDMKIMRRIKDDLLNEGFSVWIDENITPGMPKWASVIGEAIEDAYCLVIIMSPSSKMSEWVEQELQYAITHKVQIFPLLALGDEKSAIPLLLIGRQWIDIQSKYITGMARLVQEIQILLDIQL